MRTGEGRENARQPNANASQLSPTPFFSSQLSPTPFFYPFFLPFFFKDVYGRDEGVLDALEGELHFVAPDE